VGDIRKRISYLEVIPPSAERMELDQFKSALIHLVDSTHLDQAILEQNRGKNQYPCGVNFAKKAVFETHLTGK